MTSFFKHLVGRHEPAAATSVRPRLLGRFETEAGASFTGSGSVESGPAGSGMLATGEGAEPGEFSNEGPNGGSRMGRGNDAGRTGWGSREEETVGASLWDPERQRYRTSIYAVGDWAAGHGVHGGAMGGGRHGMGGGRGMGRDGAGWDDAGGSGAGRDGIGRGAAGWNGNGLDAMGSGEIGQGAMGEGAMGEGFVDGGALGQGALGRSTMGQDDMGGSGIGRDGAFGASGRAAGVYRDPLLRPAGSLDRPGSLGMSGPSGMAGSDGSLSAGRDGASGRSVAPPSGLEALAIRALAERLSRVGGNGRGRDSAGHAELRRIRPGQLAAARKTAGPVTEPAPAIKVTIGRIEVKTGVGQAVPEHRRPAPQRKVRMSLEEFLKSKKDPA